ncbi:MAG: BlaI/MecI/CopY family transcriptional regulator [Armatimonadetes bacterium]|nr:BlaI/MecI/CopY family transcriptional regulator [Armatimonadota bacterium]MBS1703209.1 BlaI/MecI/CopY family transcriptional regulator [Armatimonadota bacterium]MBS1725221.1 BlaI/MecI/CopY family transcriptional regulator [Armatimonadota bacterium]
MRKKPSIGRSESEVLRFIAEQGTATVTEVGDHLATTKGQTRNTALNMMERLRQKGFLQRTKVDGVFRYRPADQDSNLFEGFVEDFVDGILGGSVTPLVAYLGRRAEVDDEQLAKLKELVRQLDERRNEP